MPGPCAKSRKTGTAAQNSPPRKVRAKLARRQAEFTGKNSQNGQIQHMPGSQNRNK